MQKWLEVAGAVRSVGVGLLYGGLGLGAAGAGYAMFKFGRAIESDVVARTIEAAGRDIAARGKIVVDGDGKFKALKYCRDDDDDGAIVSVTAP